jgi:hypothetical protein
MRMAALARSQFTPPPAAGHRLLAEIAFEEAELMALRRPGPAAALFTLAAGEYAKADDVVGEFLARLSVRRVTPGGGAPGRGLPDAAEAAQAADAALSRLRERNPLIVAALTGTLQDAGPWRYWAEAVQGAGDEPAPGSAAEATEAAEATGQGQAPPDLQPSPGAGAAPGGTVPRPPGDARALAAAPSSVPRPSRRTSWVRFRLVAVVLTAAAAIGAGVLASIPARTATSAPTGPPGGSGGGTPVTVWIAGSLAGLAVLAALLGWCVPKVMRLAAGRGIGAVRPGLLLLELGGDTRPPPSTLVHLQARARPWGTAPRRARAMLWLVIPAVRLGTRFHLMGNPYGLEANGYDGEISSPGLPGEQAGIRWDLPRPAAAGAWWRRGRGTALGIIRGSALHGPDPATAWERILVASLGEGASGRVEWIRLLFDARMYTTRAAGSRLTAPVEWDRPLRQHYGPPRGAEDVIGLRHVIGRAVDSSAGPVMDISGGAGAATTSAGEGSLRLHGVIELKHGQPAIVVLQAEPAPDDTIGPEPPDDQAEKLRLGVELARDGVPAVLLLPVLPASIVAGLAQIIATHANGAPGGDAQRLLSRLRAAIAPHVPPPVLDDVVLFLNAVSYRS